METISSFTVPFQIWQKSFELRLLPVCLLLLKEVLDIVYQQ